MNHNTVLFFLAVTVTLSTLVVKAAPCFSMDPAVGGDIQMIYQSSESRVPFKKGACIPYLNTGNYPAVAGASLTYDSCYTFGDVNCSERYPDELYIHLGPKELTYIPPSRDGIRALMCYEEVTLRSY
ncbi:hypothetical protein BCR42DRAFT_443286 [Absidia repens]|uniref:Uncharacterized protein n=1 Tax=Absidia repens TaxID=90262 RepID=A0A1X2I136_9FUNG|nr:hypothetical protein BCR42DRAFT_443286 [Absidia repens]